MATSLHADFPDEEPRTRWNVGCVKVPYAQRDVAHAVLTEADDRGFYNVIGADDDPAAGHAEPIGAHVTYRVELTEAEADRFRAASNCRYVEPDTECYDSIGGTPIPRLATMAFMSATFGTVGAYHGQNVLIGLLDGGTTAAVRDYIGATMVAKQNFQADDPGADEITSTHGCLVAPCLIPIGGKFLDAIVSSNAGIRLTSDSAAAARWCADSGATVINYSGAGTGGSSTWTDALDYLRARNIQFFAAAGNDNLNQLYFPAAYSTTYANVHSSISFDETTGARSTFSNYATTGSGCAPGTNVLGLDPAGALVTWSGSSASCPHMARLCIMGATSYTPAQMGAALKANTRNTGQPAAQQGAGAYSLEAALTALGAFAAPPVVTDTYPYTGYPDSVAYPTIPLGTSVVNVASSAALTTALANATAGVRIMLANGTYSGAFVISKTGTSGAGISIEASTAGGAIFASGSTISVSNSAYVTLVGLSLPYELPSGGTIVTFSGTSHHCRLTRCTIGPPTLGTISTVRTVYVFITGDCDHIRIDHNELRNKANYGNPIITDGNSVNQSVRHIRVDHNYIHHISPEQADQKEPVQFGVSVLSKSLAWSVIERNHFVDCLSGADVVSIRASGVRVSGNVFKRCVGSVVQLYGTGGMMTDNYIHDDGTSSGPVAPPTGGTYRYFRFSPTALRDEPNANSVQLSEFAILNGTTRLTGMTISALNNNSPIGEEPSLAGDNSTATKWLSLNKTSSALIYMFPSTVVANGYRWATANDDTERDPISWTVAGSTDGTNWTVLDTRSNYAGTLNRSTFNPDFQFGGGGGGASGGTQTLGVGGIARPAPASNVELNSANRGDMNITVSGTASVPRIYDGGGFTCGRVTVDADYIVVQNYNIRPNSQYGVYLTGSHITIQNCDIKNIVVSGDGDLNAITMLEGSFNKILFNTAVNYVSGNPGDSHTDAIQHWISASHPTPSSNIQVVGNRFVGPANPSRDNNIASIHQCLMIESAGHGGNSGGSGTPSNWYVADNEFGDSWGQSIKLDSGNNFIFTRNRWTGSSDNVFEFDGGSGNVVYSDNSFGSGYGGIGASITNGSGPATSPY